MEKQKDFKDKKSKKEMGQGYKTYAEAELHRKSDEITIRDPQTGLYYNIKIHSDKRNLWRIGSQW